MALSPIEIVLKAKGADGVQRDFGSIANAAKEMGADVNSAAARAAAAMTAGGTKSQAALHAISAASGQTSEPSGAIRISFEKPADIIVNSPWQREMERY
jgi:hypothetical protein